MLTLHALWWDCGLHVYGTKGPARGDGTVTAEELRAAVGDWTSDVLLASVVDEASLSLRVPCGPRRGGGPSFRRMTAPTLVFSAAETIDLLANLPSPVPRACGDSVRYWSMLAKYTLALLSHQQFVPDIEERPDGTFAALWRPITQTREELAWLERHAAVMPPVCAAVVTETSSGAEPDGRPGAVPLRLVEDFVGATVDAMIRRNVGEDAFFDRIHERARTEGAGEVRWLSALLGADRTIRGTRDDNLVLADRIRTWVGGLEEGVCTTPLHLCFTLAEPEEAVHALDGPEAPGRPRRPWRVELHLQVQEHGAQRLDVAEVWSEHGGRPTLLSRHLGHRRDQLLAELSRAKEVFPLLERLATDRPPNVLELTTDEAQAFLRDWAPLLTARGFGVTVPDWATRPERRLGMQLFVRPPETGAGPGTGASATFGLDGLLHFDWRVAIGEVQLSLEEFEQLAARHTPLVEYRGAWLEIDAEAARHALTFMRERPAGRISLRDAMRVAYGAEDLDAGLPIIGLSGSAWIEQFMRESPAAVIESLRQPASFRGTLRPYQRRGLDWLAFLDRYGIGACLADDMGLGKTIQLIALLLHERQDGHGVGPTLLFAPASVVGNWEREIERFTKPVVDQARGGADRLESRSHSQAEHLDDRPPNGLRVLVHHGPERLTGDDFVRAAPRHDVVITTYALGHRDLKILRRVNWHRIVLDEAQKIKNPQTGQTIAIRSIPAARRVALTGTPIENHLPELWSIMDTLNPGLLGSPAQFRKRFVVPIEKLGDRARGAQLRRLLQPFILRRSKSDPGVICDLPEKMEMRVFCNLTPEQAGLYQRAVDETMGLIDAASGIHRRGLILALLTRLKQVCNHPCHLLSETGPLDERSGKCERLVEMLEEVLAEGDSALVFTQYRRMGHLLEGLLTDRLRTEIQFLHGGTPLKRRDQMVERFQDRDGGIRIFLLSLKAGGLGINLTAANHVFHFDRWWNPAVEAQATDRAHRVGQTRLVQVHKFVCIGTVEDRIDRMLEEKRALADTILQRGDDWLTGLSTDELRDYVLLSRDAVG